MWAGSDLAHSTLLYDQGKAPGVPQQDFVLLSQFQRLLLVALPAPPTPPPQVPIAATAAERQTLVTPKCMCRCVPYLLSAAACPSCAVACWALGTTTTTTALALLLSTYNLR